LTNISAWLFSRTTCSCDCKLNY